jgi:hypothetical protein
LKKFDFNIGYAHIYFMTPAGTLVKSFIMTGSGSCAPPSSGGLERVAYFAIQAVGCGNIVTS